MIEHSHVSPGSASAWHVHTVFDFNGFTKRLSIPRELQHASRCVKYEAHLISGAEALHSTQDRGIVGGGRRCAGCHSERCRSGRRGRGTRFARCARGAFLQACNYTTIAPVPVAHGNLATPHTLSGEVMHRNHANGSTPNESSGCDADFKAF